jgi:hypothetical protein
LQTDIAATGHAYDVLAAEPREPFVILDQGENLLMWNRAYAEMHRDRTGNCICAKACRSTR